MMSFKVLFVVYQMGFVNNVILELLFQNIQGRGEIGGIVRMNTGTQLLMLYGLVLCIVRLLKASGRMRLLYIFVAVFFALDLFIASSRFFTIVAPIAVVVTLLFCNVKVPRFFYLGVGVSALIFAGFLIEDLYAGRVSEGDAGDGLRDEQLMSILGAFFQSPMLGQGSGYSIPSLIRNDDAPFMYEVQIAAFLMQYGLLGALLFGCAIFLFVKAHVRPGLHGLMTFYLLVFFSASYFNPYMLGTYAGLSLALLVIILREIAVTEDRAAG